MSRSKPFVVSPRALALASLVVAVASLCVRLGVWQLSRYHEKRALNATLREMLARPAVDITGAVALADSLRHRRVRLRGRFDERRHVLLAGQFHAGTPGVHVLTPFVPEGGGRVVLIDRGWLEADDAVTAEPGRFRVPDVREVSGIAATIPAGDPATPLRTLEAGPDTVLSAASLAGAALRSRLLPTLSDVLITELPDPSGPAMPVREPVQPYEEFMHLSYAVQWFAFAAILLFGSLTLARARRGAGTSAPDAPHVP